MRLHAGTAVERRGSSLREGFFVDRVGRCRLSAPRVAVQPLNEETFHAADCVHKRVEARSTLDLRWQIGLSNSMNLSHKYLARGAPLWRSVGASQIRPLSSGGIPRL